MTIRELIKKHVPNFCWQSAREIHEMLRHAGHKVNYMALRQAIISMLIYKELVELKSKKLPLLYRLNSNLGGNHG